MKDYKFSAEVAEITKPLKDIKWMVSARRALMDHNFTWSDDSADKFATRIDALCSPLLEGQRNMGPIVFTFAKSNLLIVSHGVIRMCFVTSDSINLLDDLAKSAHELIQKHQDLIHLHSGTKQFSDKEKRPLAAKVAKEENELREKAAAEKAAEKAAAEKAAAEKIAAEKAASAWSDYEIFLQQVLGKVIPVSQATILIDTAKTQVCGDSIPLQKQYRLLAQAILQHVPHKTKRQALEHEIDDFLNA